MKKAFKPLSAKEEASLSKEELISYYNEKVNYNRNAPLNIFYMWLVSAVRKTFIKVASKIKDYEIVYLNDLELPDESFIIATNHKGFNDLPILLEVIEVPFHYLAANDIPMPLSVRMLFKLLGAVLIDRNSRDRKRWGLEQMSKICAQGYYGAIYPEAVNNFTDSIPLYPFWPGIIDVAKNSGKPILPVITFDKDNKVYVKYGRIYRVDFRDNREEAASILRDIMATLLWEIWETFPLAKREDVVNSYEPPNLTRGDITFKPEYELQFVYRPVNPYSPTGERYVTFEDVIDINRNIRISKRIDCYEV